MIRLTYISGKAISVSPELIKAVIEDENFTLILFGPDDDYIKVSETREEVARKVLEWRLEMEAYKQSVLGNNFNISADCASRLRLLAGLEEPA